MIQNIQYLRGICVLLVVFYHLEFSYFYFGYLGVDVFFIISGYLMPIILPKYTPFGFLYARIIRLAPVLICMVAVCLVAGFFIQMPDEYKNTGYSAIYSLLNISFLFFQQNTGYFDIGAQKQLLLHTWSLGNEVVAYLCLFAIYMFSVRNFERIVPISAFVAICIALLFAIFPDINYFNPFPRLYLFFAGLVGYQFFASIASNLVDKQKLIISISAGVLFWILFSDQITERSWPNYGLFLLPIVIVPLLAMKRSIVPGYLAKIFLILGAISYSMYIWHWPIIVLEKTYLRNVNIGIKEGLFLTIPIFIVSIISYYFIELKTKKLKIQYVSTFALVVTLASITVVATDGVSARVPSSLAKYASVEKMRSSKCSLSDMWCEIQNPMKSADQPILVLGDSHARHFLNVISSEFGDITYFNLPLINLLDTDFSELYRNNLEKSLQTFRTVFVAYKWTEKSFTEVDALLSVISLNPSLKITFIRDVPSYPFDPVACLLSKNSTLKYKGCRFDPMIGIPISEVSNSQSPVWEYVLNHVKTDFNTVDTHKALCNEMLCVGSIDGELLMRDTHHLNESLGPEALRLLAELFFRRTQ